MNATPHRVFPRALRVHRRRRAALRGLALGLLLSCTSVALAQILDEADPLRVGVAMLPPYAVQADEGFWDGPAVQLWHQVADDLDLVYELVAVPADDQIDALAQGEIDVAITAPATAEGADVAAYAPIYHTTSLGVAQRAVPSLLSVFRGVLTREFLRIALWLVALLLIVGAIVWLLERRENGEEFNDSGILRGIGAGFWWAGVTMTSIGYGDKAPITFWGRAVALLWMLVALAITASLTAAIVASVNVASAPSLVVPEDLRSVQVGATADTTSADWLQDADVTFRSFEDTDAGLEALLARDLDVFVAPTATLRYLVRERGTRDLQVEAKPLQPQRYAFALAPGSDLVDEVTVSTLRALNSDTWPRLLERYLGSPSE